MSKNSTLFKIFLLSSLLIFSFEMNLKNRILFIERENTKGPLISDFIDQNSKFGEEIRDKKLENVFDEAPGGKGVSQSTDVLFPQFNDLSEYKILGQDKSENIPLGSIINVENQAPGSISLQIQQPDQTVNKNVNELLVKNEQPTTVDKPNNAPENISDNKSNNSISNIDSTFINGNKNTNEVKSLEATVITKTGKDQTTAPELNQNVVTENTPKSQEKQIPINSNLSNLPANKSVAPKRSLNENPLVEPTYETVSKNLNRDSNSKPNDPSSPTHDLHNTSTTTDTNTLKNTEKTDITLNPGVNSNLDQSLNISKENTAIINVPNTSSIKMRNQSTFLNTSMNLIIAIFIMFYFKN
jgi:hypothetical protein